MRRGQGSMVELVPCRYNHSCNGHDVCYSTVCIILFSSPPPGSRPSQMSLPFPLLSHPAHTFPPPPHSHAHSANLCLPPPHPQLHRTRFPLLSNIATRTAPKVPVVPVSRPFAPPFKSSPPLLLAGHHPSQAPHPQHIYIFPPPLHQPMPIRTPHS